MPPVSRRDFLLLRPGADERTMELSCERLYMKFVDALMRGDVAGLFARLDEELRDVERVRLVDTGWLARDEFRREVEGVLARFRGSVDRT